MAINAKRVAKPYPQKDQVEVEEYKNNIFLKQFFEKSLNET